MTDIVICYFRNAEGAVHEVRLPAIEAVSACQRHPHEWAHTADGHTSPPEGAVFSIGNGGGIGRIRGPSSRAD